ncbi:hypothetical protein P280DRAFT_531349 [Massarina eburnea CBS 473.64]|uniref:Uncharacterized protein n=1 Tax=Massarina eburnea CBS 473.64 TaxID=1395130 RepID=A0A6A6SC08_9PLEO|nr:hypothetical protein P280DRAFT_531349 [Massarina eburnea CBS 473.64]
MDKLEKRLSNAGLKAQAEAAVRGMLPIITNPFNSMPSNLRNALHLLHLRDLEALENHFLSLEAFTKPWCHFRDTYSLTRGGEQARSSQPGMITKRNILTFYTYFMNGELRYDPRADDTSSEFTNDETKYGTYDNSHWTVADHEKLMYAWMLQEFKVGKRRNPWGIRYFELCNPCRAWEEIFVPIVTAVQESYDVRGRRYYGRLALFIERHNPSRLAFPEGNVMNRELTTAPSFRLVNFTKEGQHNTGSPVVEIMPRTKQLTAKEMKQVDIELRNVEDKYGGAVERPKFKNRMEDWLGVQKERAKEKRAFKETEVVKRSAPARPGRDSPIFGCKGVNDDSMEATITSIDLRRSSGSSFRSPVSSTFRVPFFRVSPSPDSGSSTTSSKEKKKKEAMIPYGMYGLQPKPPKTPTTPTTPKTPMSDAHSPNIPSSGAYPKVGLAQTPRSVKSAKNIEVSNVQTKLANIEEDKTWSKLIALSTKKSETQLQSSEDVYTAIRDSNPFCENDTTKLDAIFKKDTPQGDRESGEYSVGSLRSIGDGPPSAIPEPLFNKKRNDSIRKNAIFSQTTGAAPGTETDTRLPSYQGSGYNREITPGFVAHKLQSTLEYDPDGEDNLYAEPARHPTQRRRGSQHRHAQRRLYDSPEAPRFQREGPPERIPWPGQSSAEGSPNIALEAYHSSDDEESSPPPPPVPAKNPRRANSLNSVTSKVSGATESASLLGARIISKENIRAHLDLSRESSWESLERINEEQGEQVQSREVPQLNAFNKHMFPKPNRRGTPMGGWM